MPLIVVGADTPAGENILERLDATAREIRVFVSDEATGLQLRARGFKVATGDVSDESHVEAAAMRCFSAVLITEAARDDRERAFASTAGDVLEGWARAMKGSDVTRVIWVAEDRHPETQAREVTSVRPSDPGFAETVVALDDAHSIS
ncbi:MAG TPA: NAD-binding protein [Acidimicrobiia bacterium]